MRARFSFCIAVTAMVLLSGCQQEELKTITFQNTQVLAYIADEPAEQIKGLSGFTDLPFEKGMIFVYDDYAERTFWMKGMSFPLDIIWIRDRQIVGIEKNIQPEPTGATELEYIQYHSPQPVNLVLETNAGFTDQYDIVVGDKFTIQ